MKKQYTNFRSKANLIGFAFCSLLTFYGFKSNAQVTPGTSNLCVGSTLSLSDANSGGGWASTNSSASVDPITGVVTGNVAGIDTIIYTNGLVSDSAIITIVALPNAGTIIGATSICVGSSAFLTSNGISGGSWNSDNSTVASVNGVGNVTAITSGTANISYTVIANGCSSMTSTGFTVNAIPNAGTISGTTTLCEGSSALLTSNGISGGSWNSDNTTVASVNGVGNVTAITSGTANISYTVTANGCSSMTSIGFTVNALPNAGTILGTTTLCVGNSTLLTSNGISGGSWNSDNFAVATVNGIGNVTAITSGTANISYTVTANGCSSMTTTGFTVNAMPDAGTIGGGSQVCVASILALTETSTGGNWSLSNSFATIDNGGNVTGVAAGNDTVSYSVTINNCTSVTTQTITVNPLPSIIGGTPTVCELSNRTLTDSSTGGTWTSASTSNATIGASNGVMHGVVNGFTTITYTLPTGCLTTKNVSVYVTPHVGAITGVTALTAGSVITLDDVPVGGTGSWKSCNSSIASINSATGVLTAVADGITLITYSVPSAHCGTASAYATVTVGDCSTATNISTFAGNHISGFTGDGGAATGAEIKSPYCVAADGVGNVYIADYFNNVVRKVNTAGIISTFAGTGTAGYNGDHIAATAANLNGPAGVTIDGVGNIYIADKYNERIRKVSTAGIITTIAGNGLHGGWAGAGFGYGGQATNAPLDFPVSVALDCSGNIYIADIGSQTVRKINSSGIISNFAGNHAGGYSGDGFSAQNAKLDNPGCVAADCFGNVYISTAYSNRVRKVNTSGIISTVAGTGTYGYSGDGGNATAAELAIPSGITLDGCGNLYICDYDNNAVRKVGTDGTISTFAGTNTRGYDGDGAAATASKIYLPSSLAIDGLGNVYIADYGNNVVRMMGTLPYSARRFAGGTTQSINVCGTAPVSINSLMAIPDTTAGLNETWTVLANPTHGTLNGFSVSAVSKGGLVIPEGLTYTPTSDSVNTDEFTVEMFDGITRAATTINVNINATPNAGKITGTNNMTKDGIIILSNATGDKNGVWSSSDNSIATVDNTGKVTGVGNGVATIAYTVSNSCGTKTATARIAISSSAFLQQGVNLYPNPSTGSFTCEFNSPQDCQLDLVVSDVTGRVVYTQTLAATQGANVTYITLPTNIQRPSVLFVSLGNKDTRYLKTKITVTE